MTNLTLSIDEKLLRRARVRAVEEGTTVNAVVRGYLEGYAGRDASATARSRFVRLAEASRARSGRSGRRWTRDELHDR